MVQGRGTENKLFYYILMHCPAYKERYSPILSLRFRKAPAADWLAKRLSPLPTRAAHIEEE